MDGAGDEEDASESGMRRWSEGEAREGAAKEVVSPTMVSAVAD